jgi:hypothetical protein
VVAGATVAVENVDDGSGTPALKSVVLVSLEAGAVKIIEEVGAGVGEGIRLKVLDRGL